MTRSLFLRSLLALFAVCLPARGESADGLTVQLPAALTTESVARLKSTLHAPLKRFAERPAGTFVVLCDFNPDGRAASCDDFGAALNLATYFRSLQSDTARVRVVGHVRGEVRRHAVLPALACSELVFGRPGRIGPVGDGKPLSATERTAYEEVARGRFPKEFVRDITAAEPTSFDFDAAKRQGLCAPLPADSPDDARLAYALPRGNARRAVDRVVCRTVVVAGPLNAEAAEQLRRRIRQAVKAGATVIVFELRSAGGDLGAALDAAKAISAVELDTIAFVTSQARDLAAIPAVACGRIVMQREDARGPDLNPDDADDAAPGEARLGGFDRFIAKHPALAGYFAEIERADTPAARRVELGMRVRETTADLERALAAALTEAAIPAAFPAALAEGMAVRAARVHLAERVKGASSRTFLTEDALRADGAGDKLWRSVSLVKPWQGEARFEQRRLTLTATQAAALGVATVARDLTGLYEAEGIAAADAKTLEADWLDAVADFLRTPWVRLLLVMIGITCLALELKMPGVGLPGVLAAICFVLFFWSHSQLSGQIVWLGVLLFLLGLVLLGIEIFVTPGFGVCGFSGIALVLVALGLAAHGHWPQSPTEYVRLGAKIGPFGVSLLGGLGLFAAILHYLPHIPILNRLMHRPELSLADAEGSPVMPEYASFLGAIGTAATPLRPAGKVQFADEYIDVVAEGGYVVPGAKVRVVEVEGNRVVVKEV